MTIIQHMHGDHLGRQEYDRSGLLGPSTLVLWLNEHYCDRTGRDYRQVLPKRLSAADGTHRGTGADPEADTQGHAGEHMIAPGAWVQYAPPPNQQTAGFLEKGGLYFSWLDQAFAEADAHAYLVQLPPESSEASYMVADGYGLASALRLARPLPYWSPRLMRQLAIDCVEHVLHAALIGGHEHDCQQHHEQHHEQASRERLQKAHQLLQLVQISLALQELLAMRLRAGVASQLDTLIEAARLDQQSEQRWFWRPSGDAGDSDDSEKEGRLRGPDESWQLSRLLEAVRHTVIREPWLALRCASSWARSARGDHSWRIQEHYWQVARLLSYVRGRRSLRTPPLNAWKRWQALRESYGA